MDLSAAIKKFAIQLQPEVVQIRRHLHQHPELSYKEFQTSGYIAELLKKNNISFQQGFANTGILGVIEGHLPGKKVVALRADMDALPIEEKNDVEYRSQNECVMHACGHDFHMASILGTAMILNRQSDFFGGKVLLIFQPGEEKAPGGARLMLEEGIFNELKPDLIIAQHVMPSITSGKVGFREGKYMASSDEIYMTVKGKGGHAALPHQTTDPVIIAAHIILALQQIVSRNANPLVPSVLSFGKFIANGAVNIIPSEVFIEGTFRTMDETWRRHALTQMESIAVTIAKGLGASCDIKVVEGYPLLINDPDLTKRTRQMAVAYLGKENVTDLELRMTAEDFAFFAGSFPATFYRIGVRNRETDLIKDLHTPTFDVDEGALTTGMGLMAYLAIQLLLEK